MADMGIVLTPDGKISLLEFLKFRHMVEIDQPLSRELIMTGLGFLPPPQMKWIFVKKLIREVYLVRPKTKTDGSYAFKYSLLCTLYISNTLI